jgi:hypothetical protein
MAPHLMTLSEAAAKLGIACKRPGPWLRAAVLKREHELGREILVRRRRDSLKPTYLVNMATLRRWCPDLFDSRDEVVRAATVLATTTNRKLATIDDRIDQLEQNFKALVDQLRLRGLVRSGPVPR